MKSALRRMGRSSQPPVPIASKTSRGHIFNLGVGKADRGSQMSVYGTSGTVFSIVSLLAQSAATPEWRLFRKPPRDGRVRYTTRDVGSDQRTEVVQHAALSLLSKPNDFYSRFEFFEASNQHEELTGETYWVVNMDAGFPTSMWHIRPDRMEPVPSPDDYLVGWIYTGPNGEQVPLALNEVIQEKLPDPNDPFRGAGPVGSIMPNIQQQRYATEYQRNLFIAGAQPGGIITVPNKLQDEEFTELIDRWREAHQGVARAGRVGVLEMGATWLPSGTTNKDMDYANLRLNNRDELREAWRLHKTMLGNSDDVNRANAQTAQEVFVAWQQVPRLQRRRETLNCKFLPLFGATGEGVEFDFDDPSPGNREEDNAELATKSAAAAALVAAGWDPDEVLEAVGLPGMKYAGAKTPPAAAKPAAPVEPTGPANRWVAKRDTVAKVIEQLQQDYSPDAMGWVHHATWMGPLDIRLDHIDMTGLNKLFGRSQVDVDKFRKRIVKGKSKPVILVKTPGCDHLKIIDGHGRTAAYSQLDQPVRAYVGVVDTEHGPWDTMHDHQDIAGAEVGTQALASLLGEPWKAPSKIYVNGSRRRDA